MPSTRIPKAAGLWTSPSPLSAPIGSFSVADNCVIDRPEIIASRRGFSWLPYAYGSGSNPPSADSIVSFQGVLLVHTAAVGTWYRDTGVSFSQYSGVYQVNNTFRRPQTAESVNNLYFTADLGLYVIDQASTVAGNTPTGVRPAGVQIGPLATSRVTPTALRTQDAPGSGFLAANSTAAYVATWGVTDYHGTPHEGVESAPLYLANADVQVPIALGSFSFPGAQRPVSGQASIFFGGYVAQNFPFAVGDQVTITYGAADQTNFPSGTYTLTNVLPGSSITYHDGVTVTNVYNTQPAVISQGAKNVQVRIDIPQNGAVSAGEMLNTYRSYQVTPLTVVPAPQYYLVNSHVVTTADITAGVYTFADITPDAALSNPLYDNTQDGDPADSSPQNDNSQPPPAADITVFDGRLWGAYYTEFWTNQVSLLGVDQGGGTSGGLQNGDTITIGYGSVATTYTATTGIPASPTQFQIYQFGSAGLNIRQTAQSLALAVAKNDPYFYGYYTSDSASLFQGDLLFKARTSNNDSSVAAGGPGTNFINGGTFVSVSRPSAWSIAGNTALRNTNGLWFSKQNQPEAVPLLNRLAIGPANCSILRIKALRDKLYVFTDTAGVYIVANQYPYQITLLSKTATLLGGNTLSSFNDSLYCLTTQGVTKFDETGPTIISIPIEADLKRLYGVGLSNLRRNASAFGYESYRKYLIAMPTIPSDTANTQVFAYDVVTKSWTRWTKPMSSLWVVTETDVLYCTTPGNNQVSMERKNYDRTDYADEDFVVTINAVGPSTITLASAALVQPGDMIYQNPQVLSIVTAVSGNVVTCKDPMTWATGPATVYPGIQTSAVYTPMFSGEPEMVKHYREVCYHFLTPSFTQGSAAFYSDLGPAEVDQAIALGGFGENTWQLFPWAQPGGPKNKRVTVPTGSQRASYMSVGFVLREAWAQWQWLGYTPTFEPVSERGASK